MRRSTAVMAVLMLAGCGARTSLFVETVGDNAGSAGNQGSMGASGIGGTSGTGIAETCNGIDDNGNGQIDEGLGTVECGVGACRVSMPACDKGRPAVCVPGQASEEICNGLDDNCNGAVDEGLGFGRIAGPFTLDPSLNYLAYASIAANDAGFYFAYSTGFDGSHPETNVFHGSLDTLGTPTVTQQPLTTRNMTNGLRLSRAEGGFFASYCGRFDFEDRAATAFVGDDSSFSEFGLRPPSNNFCGAGTPDGLWTGQRYLFSWVDNSSFDVRLDIADDSGQSLSSVLLAAEEGDLYSHPRFAKYGDRILVTYSIRRSGQSLLRVHRLDPLGAEMDSPIELSPPSPSLGWVDAQIAAAPSGGFFLIARSQESLRIEARFDNEGLLIDGPSLGPGDPTSQLVLTADPAGGYVIAGNSSVDGPPAMLSRLDAQGTPISTWVGSDDPGWGGDAFAWPAVSAAHGRIAVLYTSLTSGVPDHPELRVALFGCQSPAP